MAYVSLNKAQLSYNIKPNILKLICANRNKDIKTKLPTNVLTYFVGVTPCSLVSPSSFKAISVVIISSIFCKGAD